MFGEVEIEEEAMNMPFGKLLYPFGILLAIGTLFLFAQRGAASSAPETFPIMSGKSLQAVPVQSENQRSNSVNPIMLVTPGPGEVRVVGEIKYVAEQQNDGQTQTLPPQPLGRVVMKLYDRQSGGDVLMATTRADDTGQYEFPPIPNRSGIDLYLEIYATDDGSADARVKVVDEDEAIWYHPLPGEPSVDVGQNLPDGDTTFPTKCCSNCEWRN
jgi:hypothetical protein